MKKKASYLLVVLTILILSGCQKDLLIEEIIDFTSPFELSERVVNEAEGISSIKRSPIEVDSEKWLKLVDFAKNNGEGWKRSPAASYDLDLSVTQDNFRLLIFREESVVIIGFEDEKGKGRQYKKSFVPGELDFIAE